MSRKSSVRFVSVLEIQRLPAEQVVKLIEGMNDGRVVLLSIYPSVAHRIGLRSDRLSRFVRGMQDTRVGAMNRMMRKLSRRWHCEDEKRLSPKEEQLDTEKLQKAAPPGFHSSKML